MTSVEGKLLFETETFIINGILFSTHNDIGRYCNEMQVADRIEFYFKEKKIKYQRELILPPSFEGERNGRNKVDFLVFGEIILEIKSKRFLSKEDYFQVQRYLHAINKKLGILVNFRDERIHPRRILNPDHSPSAISA